MRRNTFFILFFFSFQIILAKRIQMTNKICRSNSCFPISFIGSKKLDKHIITEDNVSATKEECCHENVINNNLSNDYCKANDLVNDDTWLKNYASGSGVQNSDQCPLPAVKCADFPVDPRLGADETARVEEYYRNMLTQAKAQLNQASTQRIKDFEIQMEEIAKQKINCEIAALAAKEQTMRKMMCAELEKYAKALEETERKILQEKAQALACQINEEVKGAVRIVPVADNQIVAS